MIQSDGDPTSALSAPREQASPGMPPGNTSPWPIFWVASVAVFLVSMDGTMLFAAFSTLRAGFAQATPADLSWVLNAYTIVYATMLIPSAGLADRHGRKKVFLGGVALFVVASVACGLAGSVEWLVTARVLQAIGAALLTPSSLSLVLATFPTNKRTVAVSLWGAVGGLAAAVGPSLGSFVIASFGWQWAFYLNVPVGILAIWRGAKLLTETKEQTKRHPLDLVGMCLLIAGIGAMALSIVQSESPGWSRHELLGAAGIGVVCIIGFVVWARSASAPLVDLRLFRNRTYRYANLATLTFGIAFSMMFFTFFFYMSAVWKYPLPGMLLSGISIGMVMPSLSGAAVSRLPADQYAVGGAVNQAIRQIGSAMGVALTVLFLGSPSLQRADFNAVYLCHISLALLTATLCFPVNTSPAAIAKSHALDANPESA